MFLCVKLKCLLLVYIFTLFWGSRVKSTCKFVCLNFDMMLYLGLIPELKGVKSQRKNKGSLYFYISVFGGWEMSGEESKA